MVMLTTEEVIKVEEYLSKNKETVYVFAPDDVGAWKFHKFEREHYLAWLRSQYSETVFEYTNSMLSYSIHSKVSEYLQIKWQFRHISLGVIRNDLVKYRDELPPLRKMKQTLVCLKKAQEQMNRLII